jgi:hypothetical protein
MSRPRMRGCPSQHFSCGCCVEGSGPAERQAMMTREGDLQGAQNRMRDIGDVHEGAELSVILRDSGATVVIKDHDRSEHDGRYGCATCPGLTHLLGETFGHSVGTRRPEGVSIIYGEIVRLAFALGESKDLRRGQGHNPRYRTLLCCHENVPCPEHVRRNDVGRGSGAVVGDRSGMHDVLTILRGVEHGVEVTEVEPFCEVKGSYRPSRCLQDGPSGSAQPARGPRQQDTRHLTILS